MNVILAKSWSVVALMCAVIVSIAGGGAVASDDLADARGRVRLHDQVCVTGQAIALCDVAEITGPDADRLGEVVVGTFAEGQDELTISRQAVQALLTDAGVNWGKVSLGGYAQCAAQQRREHSSMLGQNTEPAAASNPNVEVTLDAALTLKEKVIQLIEQLAEADRKDLRITFHPSDEALLARSAMQERYEFEPGSTTAGGRMPFLIRRYVGDRVAETLSVHADVARRRLAVVAVRGIRRHETITAEDVAVREVFIQDSHAAPVGDVRQVIGQTAASLLREGTVLYPKDVRSPVLVRRGELITVRCFVGGLVIKTVGRAADDGALDEVIAVRNERSKSTFTARVTGTREAVVEQQGAGQAGDEEART